MVLCISYRDLPNVKPLCLSGFSFKEKLDMALISNKKVQSTNISFIKYLIYYIKSNASNEDCLLSDLKISFVHMVCCIMRQHSPHCLIPKVTDSEIKDTHLLPAV